MDRRLVTAALLCMPGPLLATTDDPRPRHKVPAAELHQALTSRFPVRVGVPGLIFVEVSAPRLHLLPARNRLGAGLQADIVSASGRLPPGDLDVTFSLRYEGADRTLRAHQMTLLDLRWPGMPPEWTGLVRDALSTMGGDTVGEIVLHTFSSSELALPETMGFQPGRLTVVGDGLVVEFEPKTRR
ncbi:DUF1439 domain-containing protein [Ramlibacter sp. AN1015]|uniref:DUF1439 domain-containing protein n=1 Tax=Ramlibacter sp. AN1015 TaxID=3133428 RepID=UPI0030C146E1